MTEHYAKPSTPPAQRSVGERQMMIKNIFVRHDRFQEVYRFIERIHYPVVGGEPDYGSISAIVGESRAGKSYAAKRYMREYPARVSDTGMIYPVIYVDIPIEGQRALVESIASALGLKVSNRVNTPGLAEMTLKALKQQKVELLILDEVNTIVYPGNRRGISYALTLLRKILNECQLNIICIGLEETYALLAADPQLTGRGGLPCHWVRSYVWESEEEQKLFRLLVDEFDHRLPFETAANLQTVSVAQRLFYSSDGGNVGRLKDFLYSAGCLAINDHSESIQTAHFVQAYERIKPRGVTYNPWTHDPKLAPPINPQRNPYDGQPPREVFSKKARR